MSPWIEFIKEYAKKNGMSFKDAMKSDDCKKQYYDSKKEKNCDCE